MSVTSAGACSRLAVRVVAVIQSAVSSSGVVSGIEPDAFEGGFARWVEGVATRTAGGVAVIS